MTTTRMRLSLSSSKSLASKLRRRCHLHSLPATSMAAAFSCMEGRVLVHKQNHHRPKQGSQRSLSCLMNKPHDVTDTLSLSSAGHRLRNTSTPVQATVRCFETESEYHSTADEALETIQDELDAVLEDVPESEVNFASGVSIPHLRSLSQLHPTYLAHLLSHSLLLLHPFIGFDHLSSSQRDLGD